MYYYLLENVRNYDNSFNAGSKARYDIDNILRDEGWKKTEATKDETGKKSYIQKQVVASRTVSNSVNKLIRGDTLLIHLPLVNHSIFNYNVVKKLKKRCKDYSVDS